MCLCQEDESLRTLSRPWSCGGISSALGIAGLDPSLPSITGVSIDTRTLLPGDVFVAVQGPHFDGHHFVDEALAKGAASAIVRAGSFPSTLRLIEVPDTLQALHHLGAFARSQTQAKVIAITGSVGKTTVKEWVKAILSSLGNTVSSPASYNNHWGVPLSLTKLTKNTDYGIFEIGMNHPGEIAPLAKLVQPDIAVITMIGKAHEGHLGSLENIAREKGSIFLGLKREGGCVILPMETPYFDLLRQLVPKECRLITVGQSPRAMFSLESWSEGKVTVKGPTGRLTYHTELRGTHYILNGMISLACAYALEKNLEQIVEGITSLQPLKGRGALHKLNLPGKGCITLIDDAYNANPTSFQAALSALKHRTPSSKEGKKIAVIGEMRELGAKSEEAHLALIPWIKRAGVDRVYTTGPLAHSLFEALPLSLQGCHEDKALELFPPLRDDLKGGDIVFVKGSFGSNVHQIVEKILRASSKEAV